MVCLDTNVVIDFLHGDRKVVFEVKRYSEKEPTTITSLTLYELFKGAITEQQLQAVFDFESRTGIYGFEDKAAIAASRLHKKLRTEGKLVKENDILIAGTVVANNEMLLTQDADFERLLEKENLLVLK